MYTFLALPQIRLIRWLILTWPPAWKVAVASLQSTLAALARCYLLPVAECPPRHGNGDVRPLSSWVSRAHGSRCSRCGRNSWSLAFGGCQTSGKWRWLRDMHREFPGYSSPPTKWDDTQHLWYVQALHVHGKHQVADWLPGWTPLTIPNLYLLCSGDRKSVV